MPDPPQTTARVRGAEDSNAGTNNNAYAKERDARAWEFLEIHPSTARQLVIARKFPNESKARERLKAGERKGRVRFVNLVNITGFDEKLWAGFNVSKPQHEAEITEILLHVDAQRIRRGVHVDERHADAELDFLEHSAYFEHDRSTMGYAELLQRIKAYEGSDKDVLWDMQSQGRIDGIIGFAKRKDYAIACNIWFTTYEQALANFHGCIWANAEGATSCVDP